MMLVGPALTTGLLALRGPNRHWDAPRVPEVALVDGEPVLFGPHRRTWVASEVELRAGVWDAASHRLLWEPPPLGTIDAGDHLHVKTALLDGVVVTVDSEATLETRALATGQVLSTQELTDHVDLLCVSPDRASAVVLTADGQALGVAGTSGDISPGDSSATEMFARRPAVHSCQPAGTSGATDCAPAAPGAARVHVDGDAEVVVGTLHPGTPWPTVRGSAGWTWSPGGLAHPEVPVGPPVASGLVDGDVVLLVDMGEGVHLVRLDGTTGAVVFDVQVPNADVGSAPTTYSVAAGQLWVPHWTWLDAFDPSTGAHLGTIGRWR